MPPGSKARASLKVEKGGGAAAPAVPLAPAAPRDDTDGAPLPLSATPCIRIRYGNRESKVAASMLVTKMGEEFGNEVRVVLRRNHDDEESPKVIVGLDFFGISVQQSESNLWTGQPETSAEQAEWMELPVERVADLLLELAEQDTPQADAADISMETEYEELVMLGVSAAIGFSGLALCWLFG